MIEDLHILIIPVGVVALMSIPLTVQAVANRRDPHFRPAGAQKSRAFRMSRKRGRMQPVERPETLVDRWLYWGTMLFVGAVVVGFGVVLFLQPNFYSRLWASTAIIGGGAILLAPLAYRGKPVPRDWHQMLRIAGGLIALLGAVVLGITAICISIVAISRIDMWPTVTAITIAAGVLTAFFFYYMWLEKQLT